MPKISGAGLWDVKTINEGGRLVRRDTPTPTKTPTTPGVDGDNAARVTVSANGADQAVWCGMTEPEQPVVAQPKRSTGATEFAWLIERGQSMRQVPTVWWTGERVPNVEQWTTDANKAKQFASRDEAETQIEALSGFVGPGEDRFGIAVQHGFITSEPVVAQPLRAALEHLWTVRAADDGRTPVSQSRKMNAALDAVERAALAVEAVPERRDEVAAYIRLLEDAVLEYIDWDEGLGDCRYCQSFLKSGDGHNDGCVVLEIERRRTNV